MHEAFKKWWLLGDWVNRPVAEERKQWSFFPGLRPRTSGHIQSVESRLFKNNGSIVGGNLKGKGVRLGKKNSLQVSGLF